MIEKIKEEIKNIILKKYDLLDVNVEDGKIEDIDISIPLFFISKKVQKSPNSIFEELKDEIAKVNHIYSINFLKGFLNIQINRVNLSKWVIEEIITKKADYGNSLLNKDEKIVIDYSAPNIAKSFGVGHLRSTVIGNAIKNLYKKTGASVIGINHIGDWGTQFGKMITAYKLWGNKELINKNPIIELQKLYVKFHDEAIKNPKLEDLARLEFKKLEENDDENIKLWQWFKEESLKEFITMYEKLNVSFDSHNGEAFYNDKMDEIVEMLDDKKLLVKDEGALIVSLSDFNLPPALIKKTDGSTLYITRDLAALFYRFRNYNFTKCLYVVGNEQKLHFKQLDIIQKLMGYDFKIEHIGFGLVLAGGKKMSTRGGKFERLENVIKKAILDAKNAITQKSAKIDMLDKIADAVGIGAIIFNDLKNDRNLNIDFNLENMLKFEGQTGPYLQYSSVRIASIIKNVEIDFNKIDYNLFLNSKYYDLAKILANFNKVIENACLKHAPNILAKYLLTLAAQFNHFYGSEKILAKDEIILNTNLVLITSIRTVLNIGMEILGLKVLDEM